jgi:hypothetical protein
MEAGSHSGIARVVQQSLGTGALFPSYVLFVTIFIRILFTVYLQYIFSIYLSIYVYSIYQRIWGLRTSRKGFLTF